jgi:hypothetical protein
MDQENFFKDKNEIGRLFSKVRGKVAAKTVVVAPPPLRDNNN